MPFETKWDRIFSEGNGIGFKNGVKSAKEEIIKELKGIDKFWAKNSNGETFDLCYHLHIQEIIERLDNE